MYINNCLRQACVACRPGGLSNASPQEVGNLYVGKEDTLFAGKESPGRSVSRESVSMQYEAYLLLHHVIRALPAP